MSRQLLLQPPPLSPQLELSASRPASLSCRSLLVVSTKCSPQQLAVCREGRPRGSKGLQPCYQCPGSLCQAAQLSTSLSPPPSCLSPGTTTTTRGCTDPGAEWSLPWLPLTKGLPTRQFPRPQPPAAGGQTLPPLTSLLRPGSLRRSSCLTPGDTGAVPDGTFLSWETLTLRIPTWTQWTRYPLICTPTPSTILRCTTGTFLLWLTMDRSWEIR